MHPYIARELMIQHTNEMMTEASRARAGRKLRATLRARRHTKDEFVPPAIPDTVAELVGRDVPRPRPAKIR